MNVLDLFSGIGGFSLGLERAGMRTVAFCEIDPYCQAVLRKHWPDVPIFGDVRTFDGIPADVICGGFPCQPVSVAGRRKAQDDERWLWPEFARIIRNIRPRYVIIENVPGLLSGGKVRPDLGCLCGWFGRRRRIDLGAERQVDAAISSTCYQAGLEGEEYSVGIAEETRRLFQHGETPSPRETFGNILLESSRNDRARGSPDDLSVSEDQESTGCDSAALGIDMGDWGQRSLFTMSAAPAFDVDTQSDGAGICPACGGRLAAGPELVGGSAAAEVFNDLAEIGLSVEWHCIPASAVGAPHRRDRVWIVAYPKGQRGGAGLCSDGPRQINIAANGNSDVAYAGCQPPQVPIARQLAAIKELEWHSWWLVEPDVGRVADGVPFRVDRLRALGNAIVPQIAEIIGRAIMQYQSRK